MEHLLYFRFLLRWCPCCHAWYGQKRRFYVKMTKMTINCPYISVTQWHGQSWASSYQRTETELGTMFINFSYLFSLGVVVFKSNSSNIRSKYFLLTTKTLIASVWFLYSDPALAWSVTVTLRASRCLLFNLNPSSPQCYLSFGFCMRGSPGELTPDMDLK